MPPQRADHELPVAVGTAVYGHGLSKPDPFVNDSEQGIPERGEGRGNQSRNQSEIRFRSIISPGEYGLNSQRLIDLWRLKMKRVAKASSEKQLTTDRKDA
jgi:hypothetical protein